MKYAPTQTTSSQNLKGSFALFSTKQILRSLMIAGAALLIGVGPALGQMPSEDQEGRRSWFVNAGLRLVEWYTTVEHWRETALNAADTKIQETKQVIRLREKYERMAIGELGQLGEEVPDWRDYLNACAVDDVGETICQDGRPIENFVSKYEDIIKEEVEKFQSEIFDEVENVEQDLKKFVGGMAGDISEDVTYEWEEIGQGEARESGKQIKETAKMATHLDSVAAEVDSVIQSLVAGEVSDSTGKKRISSGRAQQLSAWIGWAEANIALAQLRSSVERARRRAIRTADNQREHLQQESVPELNMEVGY